MNVKKVDGNGVKVKTFSAAASLRRCRWQELNIQQFTSHRGFPSVDYDSHKPPDLIVQEPVRGGKLVMLLPLEVAEHWRMQPGNHQLPETTVFVIAPSGTLSTADLGEVLDGASGWMVELETLSAPARALYERKIDHQATRFTSRGGDRHAN
jgi:hypothetical protein